MLTVIVQFILGASQNTQLDVFDIYSDMLQCDVQNTLFSEEYLLTNYPNQTILLADHSTRGPFYSWTINLSTHFSIVNQIVGQ